MISFEDAQNSILSSVTPLPQQTITLASAADYHAAADVIAIQTIPPFANSAMDGFAIRVVDSHAASNLNPIRLPVTGSSVAGDLPAKGASGAWEIMTGAAVPPSYDTIVMIENTTITQTQANGRPAEIMLKQPQTAHQHIRLPGEDFQVGDRLLQKGEHIQPQHIMALAAQGIHEINVIRMPKVSVISTGKELVGEDIKTPAPGQIRDSNGPYLCAALKRMHADAEHAGVIPDIPSVYEKKLATIAATADVIISTGAVSAGRHDFVPTSLKKLGATILFHKVAIRPGKPILYAQLPNGSHYFGLPGNPISAAVGLRFFVYPLLRALQGQPPEKNFNAQLDSCIDKKPGMRIFQKALLYFDDHGQNHVRILPGQESFKIQPLLKANAWAILPETSDRLQSGEILQVAPLYPEQLTLTTSMEY